MKKRIGISYTPVKMANYLSWFQRQGVQDEVEIIELSHEGNSNEDFAQCDGFILTGGDDIDPLLYHGAPTYPNMPDTFCRERDEFERDIFNYATRFNKPLLGICRGLQLVNVLSGGKLVQDGGQVNAIHKSENGIDKEHSLAVNKSSLLFEITGQLSGRVNSAHHQLIDTYNIGNNLMVNATGPAGEIEGIEYADKTGKPFMLCVQWHPERMPDQRSPFSKNLLNSFLLSTR